MMQNIYWWFMLITLHFLVCVVSFFESLPPETEEGG